MIETSNCLQLVILKLACSCKNFSIGVLEKFLFESESNMKNVDVYYEGDEMKTELADVPIP
jgi:hypothetical protein